MSGGNQRRDAKMCVVARRVLHSANESNRGAMRRRVQGSYPELNDTSCPPACIHPGTVDEEDIFHFGVLSS
jgi:hypothetical protein